MTKKQYSSWECLSMLITHTVESNYRIFIKRAVTQLGSGTASRRVCNFYETESIRND